MDTASTSEDYGTYFVLAAWLVSHMHGPAICITQTCILAGYRLFLRDADTRKRQFCHWLVLMVDGCGVVVWM
jgi:hypothetical protein